MNINIGGKDVEIEISHEDGMDGAADTFAGIAAVVEIARQTGGGSHFSEFDSDDDLDRSVASEIAAAYLNDREGGVQQLFFARDWGQKAEDYFRNAGVAEDLKASLREAVAALAEGLSDVDEDELLDAVIDRLEGAAVEAMYLNDKSTPADAVPSHVVVEMPFIPDAHLLGIDDMFTGHSGVCFSAATAVPNSNFIRALKFFNVSPLEFVEEAARRGVDLTDPENGDNALRWKAVLDVGTGSTLNISKLPLSGKYEIADWNETVALAHTARDFDRQPSLTMDSLFTVLDNASYGGVPVYVARLPLKEILAGKFDKPFLATGGFIGIHDFLNGSGYIKKPDAPVLIDPSKGEFMPRGRGTVDAVYGIVGSCYRAEIVPTEVPAYQRIKENVWLRTAADGRQAEITMSKADDGADEYWVTTLDVSGSEAGPRGTAEVFLTLDEALLDGDRALAAGWTASPQP